MAAPPRRTRTLELGLSPVSALGTVGLSIGLTENLSPVSQLILIGLMYFGRVGALTMIYAMNKRRRPVTGRLPEEKITVG